MTTPSNTQIEGLISRVREATGPDRELDAILAIAFAPEGETRTELGNSTKQYGKYWYANPYEEGSRASSPVTSSIDAALALVERVLPGSMKRVFDNPDDGSARAEIIAGLVYGKGDHDSWPLAILAALLQALKDTSS